ncbi:MAG: hypothetical protein AB7P07_13910 [Hyphomonadaceae bacterium]
MVRVFAAAALYFAPVFALAFILGLVRVVFLEPQVGRALATAIEAPFLVTAMYFSARFAVPQAGVSHKALTLLGVGLFALLLQQIAEYILLRVNGQTIDTYLAYFSTTPGYIYLALLFVFTLLPLAMWRKR